MTNVLHEENFDDAAREKARGGGVQSLIRAFSILEAISGKQDGLTLADLSKIVGLHTSTTFHLTRTMVTLGYLRQEPSTKRYHLGRRAFTLAASSRNDVELVSIATPILEQITAATGESVHLAVFTGKDIVVIAKTIGSGAFQLSERHPNTRPGHATALGKILLSAQPKRIVDAYFERHGMAPLTPKTIVERETLDAELAAARAAKLAYDDGEFHIEVRCMAMPVMDSLGETVAAIGISGPIWRMSLQVLNGFSEALREGAHQISRELGADDWR